MPRSAFWRTFGLAVLLALTASTAALAQQSTQDLAEAAQNPIAAMISLPLQNNIYGEVGPNHNATGNVFNIQPVILITLGDWNIISRTVAPLIYQPGLATLPSESLEIGRFGEFSTSHFGLGDINQSFFFSPANASGLIWGVGPTFDLPTATARALGSSLFSIGPAAVALVIPRPFLIGALVHQLWSVSGSSHQPDVSQLLIQPFVNYNMEDGWYLVSSPIITANWEAPSNKWAFPIGAGFGKIFKIGEQPMNFNLQAYDYVKSPVGGPRWAVRAQLQLLFPK